MTLGYFIFQCSRKRSQLLFKLFIVLSSIFILIIKIMDFKAYKHSKGVF